MFKTIRRYTPFIAIGVILGVQQGILPTKSIAFLLVGILLITAMSTII